VSDHDDGSGLGEVTPRQLPVRVRIVMAVGSVLLATVVLVGVGLGAKTACTNTAPGNSPGCDAIDTWVWVGILATALASIAVGVLADRRRATRLWLISTGGILLASSAAILAVRP